MKLFKLNIKLFQLIGALPTDRTTAASIIAALKAIIFMIGLALILTGCSILTIISRPDDIVKTIHAILLACGGYMGVGEYIFLKWNAKNVTDFIESFEDLVNESKALE